MSKIPIRLPAQEKDEEMKNKSYKLTINGLQPNPPSVWQSP
jgi:hypothetical protein